MKRLCQCLTMLIPLVAFTQEVDLPSDFRQHNLTEYNANLFAPTASLESRTGHVVSLWTRWQWQTVDGDPTTIFLNYNQKFNPRTAGGLGIFQHNTGTFLETGALMNYAYDISAGKDSGVSVGLNFYAFQREVADTRFRPNPDVDLPQFDVPSEFLLQFSPSVQYRYQNFNAGLVAQNFVEVNFQGNSSPDEIERSIIGLVSYRVPLPEFLGSGPTYLKPAAYVKTFREYDTQFGLTALLSAPGGWVQGGYNNFYGLSAGIGATIMKRFSIGAVVEFGGEGNARGETTSFEFVTAINFGNNDLRRKIVGFEVPNDNPVVLSLDESDPVAAATNEPETSPETGEPDSPASAVVTATPKRKLSRRERLQREKDSIADAKAARLAAVRAEMARKDSIAREETRLARLQELNRRDSLAMLASREAEEAAGRAEEVTLKPGEKFEEVRSEAGLEPGYYLIANVFGTKKYFEIFMEKMREQGFEPGSFFREKNQYNYVYLERFPTMEKARQGRDSNLNGRYEEPLWIFRVREESP